MCEKGASSSARARLGSGSGKRRQFYMISAMVSLHHGCVIALAYLALNRRKLLPINGRLNAGRLASAAFSLSSTEIDPSCPSGGTTCSRILEDQSVQFRPLFPLSPGETEKTHFVNSLSCSDRDPDLVCELRLDLGGFASSLVFPAEITGTGSFRLTIASGVDSSMIPD